MSLPGTLQACQVLHIQPPGSSQPSRVKHISIGDTISLLRLRARRPQVGPPGRVHRGHDIQGKQGGGGG